MPARTQDHVHRLIASMSPAEKRYFKLHVARGGHEHGNQELLFNAIADMERYNEEALIDRFQGEPFTRHFAITKRRLYEAILHSLEAFHAESSVDARIHRHLHQAEILHQRALYADALKVLQSARRLALRHERQASLGAVREWERRLLECRNYSGIDEKGIDAIAVEDDSARRSQAEVDRLWSIKSKVFLRMYHQGAARESESTARIRELLSEPLLQDGATLLSARARFLHHHIRAAAAFALGMNHECRAQLVANAALLERERAAFMDEPNLILGVISNLAYVTAQCGQYQEAFALLKRFRSLPGQWGMPENDDLDLKLFATTTSLELSMHLRLGEAAKAVELIPVVERGLRDHAQRLGPVRRAVLQYECAYALFCSGQLEKALRWTNALLNAARHDDLSDVSCFTRLMHLLLLYDCGKRELLAYAHRNTERFMKLHGRKHRFEPRLLRLIAQLTQARGEDDARARLTAFRDDALVLLDDPMERGVLDYMDPVAWAESRLTGSPFADCIRERAKRMGRAA
ncbi:MAG: hypothetical protein IPK70_16150 [Flavobacteriales bacterium]|jgi:tetratricopeptide (TPR) repeat protein|nr:hypothetical protein [Flavobacteriales bacterium]